MSSVRKEILLGEHMEVDHEENKFCVWGVVKDWEWWSLRSPQALISLIVARDSGVVIQK